MRCVVFRVRYKGSEASDVEVSDVHIFLGDLPTDNRELGWQVKWNLPWPLSRSVRLADVIFAPPFEAASGMTSCLPAWDSRMTCVDCGKKLKIIGINDIRVDSDLRCGRP